MDCSICWVVDVGFLELVAEIAHGTDSTRAGSLLVELHGDSDPAVSHRLRADHLAGRPLIAPDPNPNPHRALGDEEHAFVGEILAGADPVEAVKYQILIMFLIAGGTGLGAVTAVLAGGHRLTDPRHRLRLDRLTPAKN